MSEELLEKKAKYRTIAAKFSYKIDRFVNVLDKCTIAPNDSLETIVFKKYLEFGDLVKVTSYINNQGYRIKTSSYKGERKFITNDIADIIDKQHCGVDYELVNAIKEMKSIDRMLVKMNAKNLLKVY
ncbi:hypothetical protein D2A34_21825 [Clostridium chromiireducens]|uniref:Uncharacterized protein n=1 Tax=Clostridium chromiireducens TaxID=225345 RepID=A0A399IKP3_9CLOT|nr:hypothetical protein [Clostridium chromiireducens]RII32839.1 hypothetical protein D2A34_21825 [Clostridium chromiireducens]